MSTERNERALEAAAAGASEAALWKALRGKKGRRALNELLASDRLSPSGLGSQCAKGKDDFGTAGLSPGSLKDILGSLPPPPEGATDKDYAAYAAAAAQYTHHAASALKLDMDTFQNGGSGSGSSSSSSSGNMNMSHCPLQRSGGPSKHSVVGSSMGSGLPLLPGMEEAAALLRASGAVGVGPSVVSDKGGSHPDMLLESHHTPSYLTSPGSLLGDSHKGSGSSASGSSMIKHAKGKGGGGGGGGSGGGGGMKHGSNAGGSSIVSFWDMDADKTEQDKLRSFWSGLSEDERRDLVKIEKHAILKEMKGQQKYICSCSVCGRRREVLEEELEMLYDAYYEELAHVKAERELCALKEQLATQKGRLAQATSGQQHQKMIESSDSAAAAKSNSNTLAIQEEDEATLANSLTVRGDMLTVCDELLEDDGVSFFDLLLKIAESRYHYRDELNGLDAADFDDDDFDDLTDDDDLTDEDEDESDEDDEDSDYLEEQRMEEGRRMFQMFAARMIEQRLLIAYREKCSLEAQEQLIREEEEAERLAEERQKQKREKEKERKKKRKEQKKAQKAAGEAAKLKQKKLEEEAKLEAKRKKEEARAADLAARQKQRIQEEQDRNEELARRAAELKAMQEAEERQKQQEMYQNRNVTNESSDGWIETGTKSTNRKSKKKKQAEETREPARDQHHLQLRGKHGNSAPATVQIQKSTNTTVQIQRPITTSSHSHKQKPRIVQQPAASMKKQQEVQALPLRHTGQQEGNKAALQQSAPSSSAARAVSSAKTLQSAQGLDQGLDHLDAELSSMLDLLPGDLLASAEKESQMTSHESYQPQEPLVPTHAHTLPHSKGLDSIKQSNQIPSVRMDSQWSTRTVAPPPGMPVNGSGGHGPQMLHPSFSHGTSFDTRNEKQIRLENIMQLISGKILAGQIPLPLGVNQFWLIARQLDPFFSNVSVNLGEIMNLWTMQQAQGRLQLAAGADNSPCIVGMSSAQPQASLNHTWPMGGGGGGGGILASASSGLGNGSATSLESVSQKQPASAESIQAMNRAWGAFNGLNLGPSTPFL